MVNLSTWAYHVPSTRINVPGRSYAAVGSPASEHRLDDRGC
jgi:hypothetical protein